MSSSTRRQEHAAVRSRRLALELITEYTLALVEIAEGRSAQELQGNIGQLGELASGLISLGGVAIPGLPALLSGPAMGAFTNLAGQLETMRSNAKVRQSLMAERETVAALVDALIDDTSNMYLIYFNHRSIRLLKGLGSEQDEMAAASNYHKSLTAYVLILKQAKTAHERLIESTSRPITSLGDLRVVMEQAIGLKKSAQEFWNAIREVRG